MDNPLDYSEIAPYQDSEVRKVLNSIKTNPTFLKILRFVDLEASDESLLQLVDSVKTIDDFQEKVSKACLLHFFQNTTSKITHEGIDTLETDKNFLFISNHRDILLDSAILNVLFSNHSIPTVETATGDNLMKYEIVRTLAKLNKNFMVIRSAGAREMYKHSYTLSSYIRKKIVQKQSSVWIAQREGRAKDNNDKTQQGLMKMLNLSNEGGFEEGFKALNIRPVSMSYEYDPCDAFKLRELLAMEEGRVHEKEEEEDLNNIIAGMQGYKGQVHLSIQPVLSQEIDQLRTIQNINDKTKKLSEIIDRSIYQSYKIFANNYIAFDLLHGTNEWQKYYNPAKKEAFEEYLQPLCEGLPSCSRNILLKKYAYPLINKVESYKS